MSTRKTYENRAQVPLPYGQAPVVQAAISQGSGRGGTVVTKAAPKNSFLSFAETMDSSINISNSLLGVKAVQTERGQKLGKLAADAEEQASLNSLVEIQDKLIKEGKLNESQSVAFRMGFTQTMGSRIGDEYGNKLRSRIQDAITNDLSDGSDPEAYIKRITDEVYQEYASQFENNSLGLAAFNKVVRSKNNEFYASTISARNNNIVALQNKEAINHASASLISATQETMGEAVNTFSNLHPDELKNEELQIKTLENTIRSLMGGEPSFEKNERIKDLLRLWEITKGAKGSNSLSVISPDKYFTLSSAQSRYEANLKQKTEIDSRDADINLTALPEMIQMALTDDSQISELEDFIKDLGGQDSLNENQKADIENLLNAYRQRDPNIEAFIKKVLPNNKVYEKAYRKALGNDLFDQSIEELQQDLDSGIREDIAKIVFKNGQQGNRMGLQIILSDYGYDINQLTNKDRVFFVGEHKRGKRDSLGTTLDKENNESSLNLAREIKALRGRGLTSALGLLEQLDEYKGKDDEIKKHMVSEITREFAAEAVILENEFRKSLDDNIRAGVNGYFRKTGKLPEGDELLTIQNNAFNAIEEESKLKFKALTDSIIKRVPVISGTNIDSETLLENSVTYLEQFEPIQTFNKGKKNPSQLSRRDQLIGLSFNMFKTKKGAEKEGDRRSIGYMSPNHIPENELQNIDPFTVPLFDNSIVKGSSWDYDNEDPNVYNILRETQKEFEDLENENSDVSKSITHPQAEWFYKNLGIKNLDEYLDFLSAQQALTNAYDLTEERGNIKSILETSLNDEFKSTKIQAFKDNADKIKSYLKPLGGANWYDGGQKKLPVIEKIKEEEFLPITF